MNESRYTFPVPPGLRAKLKIWCAQHETTYGRLLRRLFEDYLKKPPKPTSYEQPFRVREGSPPDGPHLNIRMPKDLHLELKVRAAQEHTSMALLAQRLIESHLSGETVRILGDRKGRKVGLGKLMDWSGQPKGRRSRT